MIATLLDSQAVQCGEVIRQIAWPRTVHGDFGFPRSLLERQSRHDRGLGRRPKRHLVGVEKPASELKSMERTHLNDLSTSRPGVLAALTSSGRLIGVVCGASWRSCGSSAAIASSTLANASRVSRLSVSVGSIIRASETISGK